MRQRSRAKIAAYGVKSAGDVLCPRPLTRAGHVPHALSLYHRLQPTFPCPSYQTRPPKTAVQHSITSHSGVKHPAISPSGRKVTNTLITKNTIPAAGRGRCPLCSARKQHVMNCRALCAVERAVAQARRALTRAVRRFDQRPTLRSVRENYSPGNDTLSRSTTQTAAPITSSWQRRQSPRVVRPD